MVALVKLLFDDRKARDEEPKTFPVPRSGSVGRRLCTGKSSHLVFTKTTPERIRYGGPSSRDCLACRQLGHWAQSCPNKMTSEQTEDPKFGQVPREHLVHSTKKIPCKTITFRCAYGEFHQTTSKLMQSTTSDPRNNNNNNNKHMQSFLGLAGYYRKNIPH